MRRFQLATFASLLLFSIAFADEGTTIELDGLKSTAPAAWKKQPPNPDPKFKSRVHQFKITKAEGDPEDAEMIVFFFGKGGGGGADANITRWKGQFKDAPADKTKQEKFEVSKVPVNYLDIQGTYLLRTVPNDPNSNVVEKKDFRAINAIFASPNGPYYIRLLGPNKTVTAQKKAFDEWLKNFK
jgi:hypothetical protein